MEDAANKLILPCSSCKQMIAIDPQSITTGACTSCGKKVLNLPDSYEGQMLIDEFLVVKRLGSTEKAMVYLANQLSLDRMVALKVGKSTDPKKVRSLLAEARVAARFPHPNLVQAYKFGSWQGKWFIAQEYVEGQDLKNLVLNNGALPWQRAVSIIHQIAVGLAAAWENLKVVHQDIGPKSILINNSGTAKLTDLGLSIQRDKANAGKQLSFGSPHFMSPEQLRGEELDVRSDIYSLGVTFFYALTSRPPFDHFNPDELAKMHISSPPPVAAVPDMPPQLQHVLRRMLAKQPEDRYDERELPAVLELFDEKVIGTASQEESTENEKRKNAAKKRAKTPLPSTSTINNKRVSLKPKTQTLTDKTPVTSRMVRTTTTTSNPRQRANGSPPARNPAKPNVRLSASPSGSREIRSVILRKQMQQPGETKKRPQATPSTERSAIEAMEKSLKNVETSTITRPIPEIPQRRSALRKAETPSQRFRLTDSPDVQAPKSTSTDSQRFRNLPKE